MDNFIEQGCIVEHNAQKFESGGAALTDDYLTGYLSSDGKRLTTWHGEVIGSARVVSSWKINSWQSDRMYQVTVKLPDGRIYKGRSLGWGMLFRGKRSKENHGNN